MRDRYFDDGKGSERALQEKCFLKNQGMLGNWDSCLEVEARTKYIAGIVFEVLVHVAGGKPENKQQDSRCREVNEGLGRDSYSQEMRAGVENKQVGSLYCPHGPEMEDQMPIADY